ncbi:hypothetical protein QVD17_29372 [Tagetes erecta]|uniref:ZF-HD dimerization-type domain-containing protein n=1 Tax=Tagetes erecta TaxID=13708 RepID=A0AAD8NSU6_TARER|nr:hypothetical protein QVD17_29372 [Tagetes erecta]
MDLKHTTTTTTTTTTSAAAADSPDTDGETPLHPHLIKPFSSFPNAKNHHQPPPSTVVPVTYKECLKNHAATIGSHALDGCGEFMPPLLTCATHEPTLLKCAACGCHRNFHRREVTDVHGFAPHVLLSFTGAGDQSYQTQIVATPGTPAPEIKIDQNPNGRKRFRTKFSQDQKEKMYLFAEKVGWKMQRCDDQEVASFCNEVGIKRGIFKVWMHNNKNTFGKKDKDQPSSPATTVAAVEGTGGGSVKSIDVYNNGRVVSRESHEDDVNVGGCDNSNSSDQENGGGGGGGDVDVHLHVSNNGSCSSC